MAFYTSKKGRMFSNYPVWVAISTIIIVTRQSKFINSLPPPVLSPRRQCSALQVFLEWVVWLGPSRAPLQAWNRTVHGRNPANQLRLVVYPIIYRVFDIPGGAGFFFPSTVVPPIKRSSWQGFLTIGIPLKERRAIFTPFLNWQGVATLGRGGSMKARRTTIFYGIFTSHKTKAHWPFNKKVCQFFGGQYEKKLLGCGCVLVSFSVPLKTRTWFLRIKVIIPRE